MARVLFLHGASSSGKSTIAGALQAELATPFWHLSIDHLRDSGVVPMAGFRSGRYDWQGHRGRFFDTFIAMVGATLDAGNDLILEHILDDPARDAALWECLAPHDLLFIGVHCTPCELARREAARGDRPIGSALEDHSHVHRDRTYDLDLNGEADPAGNVTRILKAMAPPPLNPER